jgi:hypothetical protein
MEQDVGRLHVPVYHPLAMRGFESCGDVPGDADTFLDRKLTLLIESLPETVSLYVWHHVEQEAIGFAGVVERQYVGVIEARDGLDLVQEPLGAEAGSKLRVKDLDGDLSAMLQVLGEKDRSHAATPDLGLDGVTIRQRGCETSLEVGHRRFLKNEGVRSI